MSTSQVVSPQQLAEASRDAMWAQDRASRALGIEVLEVAAGRARLRMTVRPDMCNGHHLCHGGMIFTLSDSTFAFACNSHNKVTVANNCSIAFIASAREGDVLTAEAIERHRGGRSGLCDVTVTDQTGKLIAVFRGHSTQIKGELVPGLTAEGSEALASSPPGGKEPPTLVES